MAGALVELFKHVLVHDLPDLDLTRARVVLEATDHLSAHCRLAWLGPVA
jgi:hypothetical protein